jgi:hypothetical protein
VLRLKGKFGRGQCHPDVCGIERSQAERPREGRADLRRGWQCVDVLGAAVFASTARSASFAFVTVMTVLLGGWAVSRVRTAQRYEDTAADRERWASIALLFWIDTAAEWVLGGGAVVLLAHFGRYALIPQFLGVIMGLHFLPLARLLRAPRYYVMGTAMILCVLASVLVPEGTLRNVVACAGIGLPMWITSVVILFQD